jgi:hypothetical protein
MMAVLLRLFVTSLQLASAGIADHFFLYFAGSAFVSITGCILFARAGLVPAMVFAAGLNLRLIIMLVR